MIKKIIFKTKQKPILNRVKVKKSKNLPGPIEVHIDTDTTKKNFTNKNKHIKPQPLIFLTFLA